MSELSPILMNRHLSLGQIAKFFSLALHQLIWNMISSEFITKLLPSHHVTYWLHCHKVLPPLKSSTFQKICHEEHTITGSNMSGLKLTFEGTKPIIGIKGLERTSENWWVEEDEVLDGDNTILLTRSVLRNTLEKTCLITTIPFSLQHD